ncbi:MAG TPA: histidine kinase [Gemmatimonadaceae bacterium]|nr:histidine kinase [Gemmatimonadaceae bacterium]
MARRSDRLFWSVLGGSAAVALLTVVIIRLLPPSPPPMMPAGTRSLPRMRAPRGDISTGDLMRSMGIGSLTWYVSILSAPLFIWLSRRVPFDRRRWPVSLAIHVAIIGALAASIGLVQYRLTYTGLPGAPTAWDFLRAALLTGTLPFVTVAAAAHALEAMMRARDRELDAAKVRGQLAEARLEALTAQLQPHFLFNTLQAISTLIPRDPAGAEKMLANLADLLREVLRRGDQREITLREELRVLESYLAISRRRFGDRLTVSIVAPGETLAAAVPFFILQPLVENALDHGVGSRAGPASVTITAEREGERLVLTVTDDGPGSEADVRPGIGLANTESRLTGMYGANKTLTVGSQPGGGFRVRIDIPFRAA